MRITKNLLLLTLLVAIFTALLIFACGPAGQTGLDSIKVTENPGVIFSNNEGISNDNDGYLDAGTGHFTPDGVVLTAYIGTPAADQFLWGDTTAAGMLILDHPIKIKDIILRGDPDSGDTLYCVIYAANGDGANTVVATSDSLIGTTWETVDAATVVSAEQIITPAEGIAVYLAHKNAYPDGVSLTILGEYVDADE